MSGRNMYNLLKGEDLSRYFPLSEYHLSMTLKRRKKMLQHTVLPKETIFMVLTPGIRR